MEVTSDQVRKAIKAIERGLPRLRALKSVGITAAKYRRLVKRASDGEEPYPAFLRSLETAESAAQQNHIEQIAASPDWKAHAFILERQYPEEWGQKIQVEVKKELEKVYAIAEEILPEEHFIRLLEGISRLDGQGHTGPQEETHPVH